MSANQSQAEQVMGIAPSLTIIVAATHQMGIGRAGRLPWPRIKAEIAYFARVTSRPECSAPANAINALIMGRKTWDSIPTHLRPLRNRVNVVVSRSPHTLDLNPSFHTPTDTISTDVSHADSPPTIAVSSLLSAVTTLIERYGPNSPTNHEHGNNLQLSRVFVIGGAEIYSAALQMEMCKRILLTNISGEWECDVYFPLRLGDAGSQGELPSNNTGIQRGQDGGSGWIKRSKAELDCWAAESVPCGETLSSTKCSSWHVEMWEREGSG